MESPGGVLFDGEQHDEVVLFLQASRCDLLPFGVRASNHAASESARVASLRAPRRDESAEGFVGNERYRRGDRSEVPGQLLLLSAAVAALAEEGIADRESILI
jgi:hypothetical protein